MFSDKYNFDEIITEVNNVVNNPELFQKVIEKYYPGWLHYSLDDYSQDYPHLSKNWDYIVSKLSTETTPVSRKKIVLVEDIIFDDNHKIINEIAEIMTKKGYVVRRECEFQPCEVCRKAIPVFRLYEMFKQKSLPVPEKWNSRCKGC